MPVKIMLWVLFGLMITVCVVTVLMPSIPIWVPIISFALATITLASIENGPDPVRVIEVVDGEQETRNKERKLGRDFAKSQILERYKKYDIDNENEVVLAIVGKRITAIQLVLPEYTTYEFRQGADGYLQDLQRWAESRMIERKF